MESFLFPYYTDRSSSPAVSAQMHHPRTLIDLFVCYVARESNRSPCLDEPKSQRSVWCTWNFPVARLLMGNRGEGGGEFFFFFFLFFLRFVSMHIFVEHKRNVMEINN